MSRVRNPRATSQKPTNEMSKYISLVEYAQLTNYSLTAIRRQIYSLKLAAIKRGGRWYILKPKKLVKK